jgi:LAO/AO transport system kinase
MDRVWSIIEDHRRTLTATGELDARRRQQLQAWFWNMIDEGLKRHFLGRADVKRLLPQMEHAIAAGTTTPTQAARRLLEVLAAEVAKS